MLEVKAPCAALGGVLAFMGSSEVRFWSRDLEHPGTMNHQVFFSTSNLADVSRFRLLDTLWCCFLSMLKLWLVKPTAALFLGFVHSVSHHESSSKLNLNHGILNEISNFRPAFLGIRLSWRSATRKPEGLGLHKNKTALGASVSHRLPSLPSLKMALRLGKRTLRYGLQDAQSHCHRISCMTVAKMSAIQRVLSLAVLKFCSSASQMETLVIKLMQRSVLGLSGHLPTDCRLDSCCDW